MINTDLGEEFDQGNHRSGKLVLMHNGQIIGVIPPVIPSTRKTDFELMRDHWVRAGGSAEEFDENARRHQERVGELDFQGWRARIINGFTGRPLIQGVAVDLEGNAHFLDENGKKLEI